MRIEKHNPKKAGANDKELASWLRKRLGKARPGDFGIRRELVKLLKKLEKEDKHMENKTPKDYCSKMEAVETNPNFWDCECVENYIHSKEISECEKCGTLMIDRTDSRADEVAILKREENA